MLIMSTAFSIYSFTTNDYSTHIASFTIQDSMIHTNFSLPVIIISISFSVGITGIIPFHLFNGSKTKVNPYLIHKKFKDKVYKAIDRLYYCFHL